MYVVKAVCRGSESVGFPKIWRTFSRFPALKSAFNLFWHMSRISSSGNTRVSVIWFCRSRGLWRFVGLRVLPNLGSLLHSGGDIFLAGQCVGNPHLCLLHASLVSS